MKKILRLGTRGSPLALIQAETVRRRLLAAHVDMADETDVEIVPIRTSGDWRPEDKNVTFLEAGGDKGLFVKEIEEALLAGVIDMAVHSVKDLPSRLPERLEIAAMLERDDPRDAFLSGLAPTLDELPKGAVVGTSSLRRQAQILKHRPDLRVVPLRGNVDTRLKKLDGSEADATVLALAGLQRLDAEDRVSSILDTDIMLPAAGQGALGIEIRRSDEDIRRLLAPIHHAPTAICVSAERAFVLVLDGSCHTPIAALAQMQDKDHILLDALVAKPDGSLVIRMTRDGSVKEAEAIGYALGEQMKLRIPPDFFVRPV
jgi:hydroxymethylbilane synthase